MIGCELRGGMTDHMRAEWVVRFNFTGDQDIPAYGCNQCIGGLLIVLAEAELMQDYTLIDLIE